MSKEALIAASVAGILYFASLLWAFRLSSNYRDSNFRADALFAFIGAVLTFLCTLALIWTHTT
jgi:hypothetical protein